MGFVSRTVQKVKSVFVKPKPSQAPARQYSSDFVGPTRPQDTRADSSGNARVAGPPTKEGKAPTIKVNNSGGGSRGGSSSSGTTTTQSSTQFSGPVPLGADEKVFRETGVTTVKPNNTLQSSKISSQNLQQTINPATNRPYGSVQPALSNKQLYQESIQQGGYVGGTLDYLQGKVSIYSDKGRQFLINRGLTNYDPRVSPIVGQSARFGAYAIPVVGAGLALGESVENLGTSKGRARLGSSSSYLSSEYNVPKPLATVGVYGGTAVMGFAGFKGLKGSVSRLPVQTKVEVVGTEQMVSGNKLFTDISFKSTRTNILSKTTSFGVSRTKTNILGSKNGLIAGESTTFGFQRKAGVSPSGIKLYGKQQQFNIISKSVSSPSDFTIGREVSGMQLSKQVSGSKTVTLGRGVIGKNVFGSNLKELSKTEFASGSYTFGETPKLSFGTTKSVGGKGKVDFYSVVFPKTKSPSVETYGQTYSGGMKTPFSKTFQTEAYQSALTSTTAGISPVTKAGKTFAFGGVVQSKQVFASTKQTYTPQVQETKTQSKLGITNIPLLKQPTATRTRGRFGTSTMQVPQLGEATKQTPIQIPIFGQPQLQKQSQGRGLGFGRGIPTSPISPTTSLPPFSFGRLSPSAGFGKMRDITGKRGFKYTASYGARVYGITGKAPKKSKFTGLELRPIVK